MHFSGLCILSSMGPWLVAGKNVVLRLRIFFKKTIQWWSGFSWFLGSGSTLIPSAVSTDLCWWNAAWIWFYFLRMFEWLPSPWLSGLMLELKSRMCVLCLFARNKFMPWKHIQCRKGERYAFMLDQIATEEEGTQRCNESKKIIEQKTMLRWAEMSSEKDVWEVGEILSCRPVKKGFW